MPPKTLPTDQEYLESLMRENTLVLPEKLQAIQKERASAAVDELIAKGILAQEDRQRYVEINLGYLDPTKVFQGENLKLLKARTLDLLGAERSICENVPVGVLYVPELNGFAIKTPRGGCAVALCLGLWSFLNIAFYCVLALIYRNSPNPIGAHHSNETYMINFFDVIDAMKRGAIVIMVTDGEHSITDCVGDAAQPEPVVVNNVLSALTFVLLHEYGHIYHGHLDENLTRRMSAGSESVEIYSTSHKQEYEADAFALRKLLRKGEANLVHNASHIIAIAMLFLIFDLCESESDTAILGTHPRSNDRLSHLIAHCNGLCDNKTDAQIRVATDYVHQVFDRLAVAKDKS